MIMVESFFYCVSCGGVFFFYFDIWLRGEGGRGDGKMRGGGKLWSVNGQVKKKVRFLDLRKMSEIGK